MKRIKSLSISEYKKNLNKLLKKNHMKTLGKIEPPQNIQELEEQTGWHKDDYFYIVRDCESYGGDQLYKGDKGQVYAPYSKNKIVGISFRYHKTIAISPLLIRHHKPKEKST